MPSKALISCAKAFHDIKKVHNFGIQLPKGDPTVDFGFVMRRMREIRAKISHHDSVQRYGREFCDVFIGYYCNLISTKRLNNPICHQTQEKLNLSEIIH